MKKNLDHNPEKSIKKNYIYNTIVQLVTMLAPIVVIPYVSRILLPEGVGVSSYATSIVSYFTLFAALGTATYGQRTIGYTQKDAEARSRVFWEIFILRVISSSIALAAYSVFIIFTTSYRNIYIILALNILNVVLDITWFYQGVEEFGKISLINICFRVLYVVSIYVFVRSSDDLSKYVFLTAFFTVAANAVLWLPLCKYLRKVRGIKPFSDFKTVLQMFVPNLAIQVYAVLDKSMIGWITGSYAQNGYYERAENIAKMALTIVTSLGTVMIPRISRKFKEGDITAVTNYVYKSYRFVWLLGTPTMLGLISVAPVFVPVFLGEAFNQSILLLQVFSALVIIIGLNNVTAMQYFVPIGKQNVFTFTVIIGAVINFIMNLFLIRLYGALGACIASVTAEFCVTTSAFIAIVKLKQFPLKPVFTCSWKYLLAGLIMTGSVLLIKQFLPVTVWALIVLIAVGIAVYGIMLLILRDEMFCDTLLKIFGKIKRRKEQKSGIESELSESSDGEVKNVDMEKSEADDSGAGSCDNETEISVENSDTKSSDIE